MKRKGLAVPLGGTGTRVRVGDFVLLTKAGLTALSVCTAAIGALLASMQGLAAWKVLHVVVGTYLLGSGAAVLNQFVERGRDALMVRTAGRPLPSGRMHPGVALVLGSTLSVGGLVYLMVTTNPLAAGLGFATLVIYVAAYTPLKPQTHLSTIVGAIPGSLPPLIGWAAVQGEISFGGYILFVIMFLWQIPHFLALGWMYREDYRKGGYQLLPVIDMTGLTTARLALIYAMCLVPAACMLPLAGLLHPAGLLLLLPSSWLFVRQAVHFYKDRNDGTARQLFMASLVFLPVLLVSLAAGKVLGTFW